MKENSSCTMCSGLDTNRMVQCDSCDGWCHYECAGVGDEIENLSFHCIACTRPPCQNLSAPLKTPENPASPLENYGTPLSQADGNSNAGMLNDGQSNMFEGTPSTSALTKVTSNLAALEITSSNVPQSSGIYAQNSYAAQNPVYTLTSTRNTLCGSQVSTRTAALHSTLRNNSSDALYNKQAAASTSNFNVHSNWNPTATMFQQNQHHTAYKTDPQRNENSQQERMRHNYGSNQYANEFVAQQQRSLELQMLEEEQKLKQHFLQKKYELLQQCSSNNAYQQNYLFNNNSYAMDSRNMNAASEIYPTTHQLSARQVLPKDLPQFHGDPEEWPIFISSFNNSTAVGGFSNAENLIRLQQCLKGKAREIVRSKLLLPTMVPEIIQTLEMYYGRPELILERVIEKARHMTPPKDKLEAIIDYAVCVKNICSTIEACKMEEHLNNPMLVRELLEKLSNNYKLQWAMQPKPKGLPTLKIFSDWLYSIAEAASQVTTPVSLKRSGTINTHTEVSRPTAEQKCFGCNSNGHKLSQCSSFKDLPINKKWEIIKEKKICKRCLNKHRRKCYVNKDCGIDGCTAKHHPHLHSTAETSSNVSTTHVSTVDVNSHRDNTNTSLFRILPVRIHAGRKYIDTYAFLDEGSSITLMEEEIFKSLNMRGEKETLCLRWTSGTTRVEDSSYKTSFNISSSQNNAMYKLNAVRTVKNLSLPQQTVDANIMKARHPYLSAIPIQSYRNVKPTILIGNDNWNLAVPLKVCEGPWNQPIATKTRLGWALQGFSEGNTQSYQVNSHMCECKQGLDEIHEAVKNMFALESSPLKIIHSAEDEKAIRILESTCEYKDVRYEVGLLWHNDQVELPDSYDTAYKRAACLQKRIKKDVDLKANIKKEISNLLSKNYARKLTQDEIAKKERHTWYLPIFVTTNQNKPDRVRLVWDGAAKTNGISLNDFLLSGPDLLNPLINILLSFRVGRIAISGDIAEMFHQILIRKDDTHAQRFLWWNDDDFDEPTVYVMNVLTFGLNCAPCMAHFIRNKNADRYESQYPRAVEAIKKYHYVDDLIDSVDSEDEAVRLGEEIKKIHASGGFMIRNWASNSTTVLNRLHQKENVKQSVKELGATEKILGVHWDPAKDVFKYDYKFPRLERDILTQQIPSTKREILKVLMSIYDPLGFISCYTIGLKILLQEIWRSGINWDENLPVDLNVKWQQWKQNLPLIMSLEVPRCYSSFLQTSDSVELHTFVDASELAYAAICYLKVKCAEDVSVLVVMAKSKVAPLKPISVPRLELQAAVLGIRLALKVTQVERIPINSCYWWSDSKTVLKWLRMDPRKLQQFVMHRVGEILEHSEVRQWKWVPSKFNPADLATKVTSKPNATLWINGPEFLMEGENCWPECNDLGPADTTEVRSHFLQLHIGVPKASLNVQYFSDWKRLYRALATLILYMEKLKSKAKKITSPQEVTYEMICKSKVMLYSQAQSEIYSDEINSLKFGKNISKHSPLICFNIFLDDDGLLKVRGRTEHLSYHRDVIVLPKDHHVTHLVVKYAHEHHHHVSHETVINNLKSQYYIPKLRVVYKKVRNSCQRCKNAAAVPVVPKMASLPPARLGAFERPFTYTGIDYFGPMTVTVGRRSEKRWGVIFTCLTTRAVHLEVAHSLDTASCVMCLRNFIGRRGYPRKLYTDNGTNFKATEKVLREELHKLDESQLIKTFDEIQWVFNPPAAPHMGGAWERLVRSVKTVLHNAYPNTNFNDETLRSALIEVEFMINSRPLTFVSLESADDEAITPNHLLLGSSTGYKPICSQNFNLRQRWTKTQAFADQFWRRWIKEYTPMITRRNKWFVKQPPITVGDIVLIVDENQARNCWLRGVIIQTMPAKDGQVRRAIVQTKNGILHRPASKLAVLDVGISGDKLGEVSPAYGGGNVAADTTFTCAIILLHSTLT